MVVRFISVDAERFLENFIGRFFARRCVFRLMSNGTPIIFASETKEAAVYIKGVLGIEVNWLPTPLINVSSRYNNAPLTLFIPGKPRVDKGSFEIGEYQRILADQGSSIKIIHQKDNFLKDFESSTSFLKTGLSLVEYNEALQGATWLFAPHKLDSFKIRGSALLTDSLENRIPILSRRNTSLGNFVDQYKIGATFTNFSDFYSSVVELEKGLLQDYSPHFDAAIHEVERGLTSFMEMLMGAKC